MPWFNLPTNSTKLNSARGTILLTIYWVFSTPWHFMTYEKIVRFFLIFSKTSWDEVLIELEFLSWKPHYPRRKGALLLLSPATLVVSSAAASPSLIWLGGPLLIIELLSDLSTSLALELTYCSMGFWPAQDQQKLTAGTLVMPFGSGLSPNLEQLVLNNGRKSAQLQPR